MQGQESGIDSFREAIDNIGQGSDSSSADMNHQSPFNSMIPPVESRWSSYASSGETCVNAGTSEPSGSAPRNQANDEGAKIEHGRLSPYGSHHTVGSVTEEILFPGRAIISLGGNQVNGPSFSQGSSSNHMRQHVNLNAGYVGSSSNGEQGIGASLGPNLYLSSRLETESSTATSSDIVGTSAGSSGCIAGEADGSTGSLGNWGLSCKRKALEATSGQSCSGGSSSSYLQPENCLWHNGPARYNPSSSLRLSAPSGSSQEQQIPRPGIPAGTVATDAFPSSSATESGESPPRQVGSETNSGSHHESIPFNLASAGSSGRYSRRPAPFGDPSGLRSTAAVGANLGAPQSQSHNLHVPGFSGNLHNFPWNGASNSRGGTMTSSFSFGERATDIREEANLRSIPRTNVDHAMFVPANEMRNTAHDPTSSSLASGNLSTSLGIPASTRIASTSSNPPLPAPAWIPHHNSPSQSRQRTLEFAPWSLFPSIDSQPVGHGGNSDPLPPGPSSSRDTIMSSGRNNQNRQQPYLRSSFLTDRQGEDALSISNSLRVLSADIEGRRRLISEIRQVLHAMRRGENLQIEDYMLFDPFMYHGMAEMHDRHRDMRLDVDNMSYEELLALEERIGDVSTGLSEATILKLMKQRKYESIVESTPDTEPCCICQEEFADGDDVGALDCGHDFHTDCVKQWLMQKNLCPICKTTGLLT